MEHPAYPDTLACGCICAGHMEENLLGAKKREDKLKSDIAKKDRFIKSKSWYIKPNGNHQIDKYGCKITIYQKNGRWSGVLNSRLLGSGIFLDEYYSSIQEAKGALFDMIPKHML
jgi:hypothetical protein